MRTTQRTRSPGYSVINDVTMRDYQYRSPQWFQGKTFEATAPFGPVLVTPDEFALGGRPAWRGRRRDGPADAHRRPRLQPAFLVSYISKIVTLNPGDVIATGTPGGVGHARKPARYLTPGATLVTDGRGHRAAAQPHRRGGLNRAGPHRPRH